MIGISWSFQTQFITALVIFTIIGMWWAEHDDKKDPE